MLILSRKLSQSIVINGGTDQEVVITVAEIRGDRVRLGIQGDKSIRVNRCEVERRIRAEREVNHG